MRNFARFGSFRKLVLNGFSFVQDRLMERVMALAGPTHDLPTQDTTEKKFSGRNRLYVGNLTSDVTEEEITTMFSQYGEVSEVFVNTVKNFAFLRMVRFFVHKF